MPAQKLGPCKALLASGVILPNKGPGLSRELLLLAIPWEKLLSVHSQW